MTGLEAIPKISELLARLIKLTKDRETGALVQQIQQHQLVIHTALVEANSKIHDLERQLEELQAEDFQFHSGVEFRRGKKTGGKWMAFCTKCHLPASPGISLGGEKDGAICSANCGWSIFIPKHLDEIIKELEV